MSESTETVADTDQQPRPRLARHCHPHTVGFFDRYAPQCACHLLPDSAPVTSRGRAAVALEATAARQAAALQVREAVANHGPARAVVTAQASRMTDEWAERASDPLDDEVVTPARCLRAAWHAAENAAALAAPDEPATAVEWDNPTYAAGWQTDHDRHEKYSPHAAPEEHDQW